MLSEILTVLILMLAVFVFVASLCRVNILHLNTHQPLWVMAYFLIAVWGAIAAVDTVMFEPDATTLVGLAGVALWLWGSRLSWREGAPKYLER